MNTLVLLVVVLLCGVRETLGDLSYSELRELYNSRVTHAEYYECPLSSLSSSQRKRRKRWPHNMRLVHAGVVVDTDYDGYSRWLIHKGSNFGIRSSTVITDAAHMSSVWHRTKCGSVSYRTVEEFMQAAYVNAWYDATSRLYGENCQSAANNMWDNLVDENMFC